ncbi:MAG: TolC family protein [bacterium]
MKLTSIGRMQLKRSSIALILIFISTNLLSAREMTLDGIIEYARLHSPTVKMAKFEYYSSVCQYKQFKAEYLPQLYITGSAPGYENSIIKVQDTNGITFHRQMTSYSNADLTISQRFSPTGATISLSSGLSRLDVYGMNQYSDPWAASPVLLSISQPLFRFNSMRWDNKLYDMRYENARKRYNEVMEEIAIQVADKFYSLYMVEMNVNNSRFNLEVNDTMYKISKGRYSVGKIAENELLQNELGVLNSEMALDNAQINFKLQADDLKLLIGMDISEDLTIIPDTTIKIVEIDYKKALNAALENCSNIMDYKIQKTNAELNVDKAKSNNDFDANISANFGLNQKANQIPDAYKSLLDQERVDITFTIPIFQWNKSTYEVEAALADKYRVEADIDYKMKQFEQAIKYQTATFQLLIRQAITADKSYNIAKRRFDVAKNRYVIGNITMDVFFTAQNEKDQSFNSYISALKNYWMGYYSLRRATLYDFNNNKNIEYNPNE